MKKVILIAVILLIAGIVGYALSLSNNFTGEAKSALQGVSIEEYVKQNISELSPEKEVLGGKFYVTEVEANAGTGTVAYEDGHVAYVADFTYSTDDNGAVKVDSFVVRK